MQIAEVSRRRKFASLSGRRYGEKDTADKPKRLSHYSLTENQVGRLHQKIMVL
jgi:hypothetical protein